MAGWQEFDYSYLSSHTDLGYRPYVEVNVEINNLPLTIYAIIDSGCQDTLISAELAPIFDFLLEENGENVAGVGGDGKPGYRTKAVLTFPKVDSIKIETPVLFTEFPADMLLGQENFFKNFEVLFKGREGKFLLKRVKNFSDER